MSVNTASNGPGRLLLMGGERVIDHSKNVDLTLEGNNLSPKMTKKASGTCYLTTRRVILLVNDNKELHSFSMDFASLSSVELEQPIFGANYIKALVRAEAGGGWDGTAKMKLIFNSGGAISFGKQFLHMVRGGAAPPQLPPTYTDFNYDPYGAPPAPYGGPPAPYGAPPYGYVAPPYSAPGYVAPPYGAAPAPYGAAPAPYTAAPAPYGTPPAPYGAPAYGAPAYGAPGVPAPPNYVYDQPAGSSAPPPPYIPGYSGNAMYSEDNPDNVYVPNSNTNNGRLSGSTDHDGESKKTK